MNLKTYILVLQLSSEDKIKFFSLKNELNLQLNLKLNIEVIVNFAFRIWLKTKLWL